MSAEAEYPPTTATSSAWSTPSGASSRVAESWFPPTTTMRRRLVIEVARARNR